MKNSIPFRRTVLTCVIAAFYPLAQPVLAQSTEASCNELLVLADAAEDQLSPQFADVRDVAMRNDANECTLYSSRIVEAGGLSASEEGSSDTSTQTLEIEREATISGEVQVTLPDPQVNIEQSPAEINVETTAPDVTVDQAQPSIVIRQAQPIITVRMTQPTITVEQPAPEIIITMPDPSVSVANAQPRVEVNIPEPRVTVVQGEPQLNVDLASNVGDAADRDPELERLDQDGTMTVSKSGMSSSELEPRINYTATEESANVTVNSAEPDVQYKVAEPDVRVESEGEPQIELIDGGEPKIVIQTMQPEDRVDSNSQALANVEPGEQRDPKDAFAADPSDSLLDGTPESMIGVGELNGMEVVNGRGELLGEVNRVVQNGNDTYLIVEHGGWFFDLNDKQVAFPIGNVMVRDDNVVLRGMTEEQIDAMPDYDYDSESALEGSDEVQVMRVIN